MDLVKSIQSTLYERVVSPLAGIFVMSWVVMHYDLIMMLMSKNDMMYKTQMIYEYMVVDAKYNWGDWIFINAAPYWYGLFIPLLCSFIALISYSLISPLAFKISSWSKHRLQLIRRDYDKRTPVSAERFMEVEEKFNNQASSYREDTLKYEADVEHYKNIYQSEKSKLLDIQLVLDELKEKNMTLQKEVDGLREANATLNKVMRQANVKEILDKEAERRKVNSEAVRDIDGSDHSKIDDNIDSEEVVESGPKTALTGEYSKLFFDSSVSDLSRRVLQILPIAEKFDAPDLALSMMMPKTQGHIDNLSKILQIFEMYHLIESIGSGVYSMSLAGRGLQDSLKKGVDELRKACDATDGISNL